MNWVREGTWQYGNIIGHYYYVYRFRSVIYPIEKFGTQWEVYIDSMDLP